jgi:hAT family C-terminal dimerisation region
VLAGLIQERNIFDAMLDMPPTASQASAVPNELTTYLAAPVDSSVRDPLKWWWDHRFEYPHLSRMGRDYLSIPGTS